jgi:myo-inositol 2-dehydrogenase/D-chiro-inositol 1-dehydrogenase
MTPSLRLGVLGCGRATVDLHLPALRRIPEIAVVAVADADPARLDFVARTLPAARRFEDPRALLDAPDVDALLVALPVVARAEWGVQALESGRHVLMEKPLALTAEAGERLVAAARGARGVTALGFNLRHHRLIEAARRRVANGELGELVGARLSWSSDIARRGRLPSWRARRATGGGVLWELGSHHWDLLPHLTGQTIVEVAAMTTSSAARDDDSASVALRLDGGAVANAFFAQAAGVEHRIELHGTAGMLEIDLYRFDGLLLRPAGALPGAPAERLGQLTGALHGAVGAFARRHEGGGYLATYASEWRAFLAAVREGGASPCPLADGLAALRVTLAVERSLTERRCVEVAA